MQALKIIAYDDNRIELSVMGAWTKRALSDFKSLEHEIAALASRDITLDFTECKEIDSAGAVEILRLKRLMSGNRCSIMYRNLDDAHERMLNFYEKNFQEKPTSRIESEPYLERLGRVVIDFLKGIGDFTSFIGRTVGAMGHVLVAPWNFRFTSFIKHIHTTAIGAVPIVTLLSFLIGLVVAYQAAGYLTKVGGDIFIVDLSVMSVFRELSPMITAILIAARSASSFTAEIGTMKITEEIDAMRTMGFDPYIFLVLPRVLALVLMMPFLIFVADMAGMAGTLVVSWLHLGISVPEFIDRMYLEISINELYVGLGKSPIYGAIVALVGCYRGFQVSGSTESIGRFTIKSVVSAIFWVIICDACIAVALTKLGI